MNAELRVVSDPLQVIEERSFIGRVSHSSESRFRIWSQLGKDYTKSPLGIGPGNSRTETVSFAQQERPHSLQSKEAHSDYLSYLIERGPLALAGLLLMTVQAFMMVGTYWKWAARQQQKATEGRILTAALVGTLVATSVHSMVIEKQHFRHFWLFLALVCALSERAAFSPGSSPGEASHGD